MFLLFISIVCFGAIWGLIAITVADWSDIKFYQKMKCKWGKHAFTSGLFIKKSRYYCQVCRVPRKHPDLKPIEGGKVRFGNFKF